MTPQSSQEPCPATSPATTNPTLLETTRVHADVELEQSDQRNQTTETNEPRDNGAQGTTVESNEPMRAGALGRAEADSNARAHASNVPQVVPHLGPPFVQDQPPTSDLTIAHVSEVDQSGHVHHDKAPERADTDTPAGVGTAAVTAPTAADALSDLQGEGSSRTGADALSDQGEGSSPNAPDTIADQATAPLNLQQHKPTPSSSHRAPPVNPKPPVPTPANTHLGNGGARGGGVERDGKGTSEMWEDADADASIDTDALDAPGGSLAKEQLAISCISVSSPTFLLP